MTKGTAYNQTSLGRIIWDGQGGMGLGGVLLNTLCISYGRIHGWRDIPSHFLRHAITPDVLPAE